MITIAEVIEQCAQAVYNLDMQLKAECVEPVYYADTFMDAIRALAAQYEGCIVAEGEADHLMWDGNKKSRFYRARETQR